MKKEFDLEELSNMEIDDDLSDIEIEYTVVYVKFSKYSKEYAYLVDDDVKVEVGTKVWVPDKKDPLEVIRKEVLDESKLPLPVDKMKTATLERPIKAILEELINNNPVLRIVEKKTDLIGRKDVIDDLAVTVAKKRMKNSILIGDAGCGKTTIVEEFADLIKKNCIILGFNVGELIAGTSLRGMLEEKLTKIFNDVLEFNSNNKYKIILFIDEFHMIVSNSGCDGTVSMHDILKPYLTNPNIMVIGATTIKEYNQYVKKDFALMRRITPIYVNKLDDDTVIKILDNFSNHSVNEELLKEIINRTKEIPNTTNPDISLEVLDRVLAKNKVFGYEINMNIIAQEVIKLKQSYEIDVR